MDEIIVAGKWDKQKSEGQWRKVMLPILILVFIIGLWASGTNKNQGVKTLLLELFALLVAIGLAAVLLGGGK